MEIILWFAKSENGLELERTLCLDKSGAEFVTVRGKTAGAYKNAGKFQWTPGVKALSIVFLRALALTLRKEISFCPLLEGGRGSLASSLDYALSKQPEWLFDMFGHDDEGNAVLRKVLFRSNSSLRRVGNVGISLNEQLLDPQNIKVYIGSRLLTDAEEIEALAIAISRSEEGEANALHSGMPSEFSDKALSLLKFKKSTELVLELSQAIAIKNDTANIFENIQPIAEFGVDDVYLFEQLQFPGSCATRDRLIGWQHLRTGEQKHPPVIAGRIVQAKHLFEELSYLTCDSKTQAQFEQWIAGMTPERDAQWGLDREKDGRIIPGFLSWIQEHNRSFTPDGFHRTFFWRDRLTKEMVATLTIAPDDRGVRDRYKIPGDGQLGGINVRWDLRYRGIGKYLAARINQHVLEFASREHKAKLIHTCTFNHDGAPFIVLRRMNYVRNPIGLVDTDFGTIPVWTKEYLA